MGRVADAVDRSGESLAAVAEAAPVRPSTERIPPSLESELRSEIKSFIEPKHESAPTEAKPDITESAAPDIGDADWSTLVYGLDLGGLGREILANSLLESSSENCLRIGVPAELRELATEPVRAEILAALEARLGVSLRLDLISRDALTEATPLQLRKQQEENERLAAIAAIRDEAVVRKLHDAFAAELDEASVAKIETQARGER